MDKLAETLSIDPVELRRMNALHVGSITNTGQVLKELVGLTECIDKVSSAMCQVSGLSPEDVFKPRLNPETPHLVRSWGFASAYKNTAGAAHRHLRRGRGTL